MTRFVLLLMSSYHRWYNVQKKIIIINYISFPSATTKRIGAKLYAFNVNFNIDTLLMCTKEMVAKKNGSAPNILSADHFFLFWEKKKLFFSLQFICVGMSMHANQHTHIERERKHFWIISNWIGTSMCASSSFNGIQSDWSEINSRETAVRKQFSGETKTFYVCARVCVSVFYSVLNWAMAQKLAHWNLKWIHVVGS